ncbi:unnamed protein product [Arctia plantaginis]|uniref:Cilia- and flagella-associated protein 251 n=1 Tax=Arctia plantaginis TaxID=874455 RepID=A0A8S0ZS12_ARCPL|nr:unnamed protein product [Arctia plantaginis]
MDRQTQSMPNLASERHSDQADFTKLISQSPSSIMKLNNLPTVKLQKFAPFSLRWIHGYNQKVGVINLNKNGSTVAFYAAANCAVLYNWTRHQMRMLQGHKHTVTCIAIDGSGNWLVTADSGPENILIIWDYKDLFPQKTLFSPHGASNIAKIAMSSDAKYLLTMAYIDDKISLHWWIWSFAQVTPHATIEIAMTQDAVLRIGFNPFLTKQFIILTKSDIWIGISRKIVVDERGVLRETDNYELKVVKPEKKINPEHGNLTCYTFVEDTCQILVATNRGAILVFGYEIEYNVNVKVSPADYENLRFIKVVKVEKKKINVIKSIDKVVITGNNVGQMHFYDDQLKLLYWIHKFPVDCIKTLSFNLSPRSYKIFDTKCKKPCICWEKVKTEVDPETGLMRQKLLKMKIPYDATTSGKPFLVRDFIISTVNSGVGFVDFVTEKVNVIIKNRAAPVITLSVHPEKSLVCLGFADGILELYNFVQHKTLVKLDLRNYFTIVIPPRDDSINCNYESIVPKLSGTCLHLACGLNTGELIFLDPIALDIKTPKSFKDTSYNINKISFSPDSLTMATADVGKTICVYKYDCTTFKWTFIGKHRAHYKEITVLLFLPEKNADGNYKLLSLGKDRMMVEYDIGASKDEYLQILSLDRVEQSAIPLAGIVWPTPDDLNPDIYRTKLPLILVAGNEFKYKIVNYESTMTLATVLGPRYETPVCKMFLVHKKENNEELQYLVFVTKDIIGLQKLPLDGNPWKHVGMLGHPVRILDMDFREDIGTLFTIGEKDTTMMQWTANYRSVEGSTKNGGGDLDPYYCLVEDSRPGWLFQEIRDLFYYIQILCQGTFSPAMRRVKDYIPIDSLPDLMRALGFFPSEYEVENLLVEAKYKVYRREPLKEIDFDEFVKLYLNHRPVFGENFKRIRGAFRNFATIDKNNYSMSRDAFIEMLTTTGERFSSELAWYLLSILSGHSFEDRAVMPEEDFWFLPEDLTFSYLVNEIIGMQEIENVSEGMSNVESSATSLLSVQTLDSESD